MPNVNEGDRTNTGERENKNEVEQEAERDDGPESEDEGKMETDMWNAQGAENQVYGGEDEHSAAESGRGLNGESCVSEVLRAEATTVVDIPMEESQEKEEGGLCELEKRDEWPAWLKAGVDMLWAGKRGKELESILIKLIKIERGLGFKGEKTVRFTITMKEPPTHQQKQTGRQKRPSEDGKPARASWGIHGLS